LVDDLPFFITPVTTLFDRRLAKFKFLKKNQQLFCRYGLSRFTPWTGFIMAIPEKENTLQVHSTAIPKRIERYFIRHKYFSLPVKAMIL